MVTDLHFGARSDSVAFDAHFRKFYEEVFFPELIEQGIKTVFDLGDTFDRRKYINYNTLKSCKEYFFDRLQELDIDLHMIPGNHDTYFKNTNDVNSPDLLLRDYTNIAWDTLSSLVMTCIVDPLILTVWILACLSICLWWSAVTFITAILRVILLTWATLTR